MNNASVHNNNSSAHGDDAESKKKPDQDDDDDGHVTTTKALFLRIVAPRKFSTKPVELSEEEDASTAKTELSVTSSGGSNNKAGSKAGSNAARSTTMEPVPEDIEVVKSPEPGPTPFLQMCNVFDAWKKTNSTITAADLGGDDIEQGCGGGSGKLGPKGESARSMSQKSMAPIDSIVIDEAPSTTSELREKGSAESEEVLPEEAAAVQVDSEDPGDAIVDMEELLRITFNNLAVEWHLLNVPTYGIVRHLTKHDQNSGVYSAMAPDKNALNDPDRLDLFEWIQVQVMVRPGTFVTS